MKVKLKMARYINPAQPMVALTFDDGPSLDYTPEILKVLRDNNAKATFFVLGSQADLYPDILKQVSASGSEIGNHSYSHLNFTKLAEPALEYQVSTTQEIIKRATGQTPSLLRPPYGAIDKAVKKIDMPLILWSIDSLDWKNKNPDIIYDEVINNIKNGDIVLMHDIYKTSAEAAARVIPELRKKGYQLVTVSELARERGIPLKSGNVYGNLYPIKKM